MLGAPLAWCPPVVSRYAEIINTNIANAAVSAEEFSLIKGDQIEIIAPIIQMPTKQPAAWTIRRVNRPINTRIGFINVNTEIDMGSLNSKVIDYEIKDNNGNVLVSDYYIMTAGDCNFIQM